MGNLLIIYWGSSHWLWWGILLPQSAHTHTHTHKKSPFVFIDERLLYAVDGIKCDILEFLKGMVVWRTLAEFPQCRPAGRTAAPGRAPAGWWPPADISHVGNTAFRQTRRKIEMLLASGVVELTPALSGSNQVKRRCNLGPPAGTSSEDISLQRKMTLKALSSTTICPTATK